VGAEEFITESLQALGYTLALWIWLFIPWRKGIIFQRYGLQKYLRQSRITGFFTA